jgi:hypothetical protein
MKKLILLTCLVTTSALADEASQAYDMAYEALNKVNASAAARVNANYNYYLESLAASTKKSDAYAAQLAADQARHNQLINHYRQGVDSNIKDLQRMTREAQHDTARLQTY